HARRPPTRRLRRQGSGPSRAPRKPRYRRALGRRTRAPRPYCRRVPRVYLAGPPFADEYRGRASALARAAGWEPVDPMRRDFRGGTKGHEAEIVAGDLEDIDSCDAVVASFTASDEGT